MNTHERHDFLWRSLLGELQPGEKRRLEQLLEEDSEIRAEYVYWQELAQATRGQADARVREVPALGADFLAALPAQNAAHRQINSTNTAAHPFPRIERENKMIQQTLQAPASHPWALPKIRISFPLVAAVLALLFVGGLGLFSGGGDGNGNNLEPQSGSGAYLEQDQQEQVPVVTVTPVRPSPTPSQTAPAVFLPTMVPTPTPFGDIPPASSELPPFNQPNSMGDLPPFDLGGPFPHQLSMTATSVPPFMDGGRRIDPRASITPSSLQAIVPFHESQIINLPGGDFGSSLDWSEDGSQIAVASFAGTWLFDTGNLQGTTRLIPDTSGTGLVDVVLNDEFVITLDWNAFINIYDLETGNELIELTETTLWDELLLGGDGRYLFSTSTQTMLDLGDVRENGVAFEPMAFGAGSTKFTSSSGNKALIITSTGNLMLRDFTQAEDAPDQMLPAPTGGIYPRLAIDEDATRLAVANQTTGEVLLYDLENGDELARNQFDGIIWGLEFKPGTDDQIAVNVHSPTLNTIWLWQPDASRNDSIVIFDMQFNDMAFAPDGEQLALITGDGKLIVLDMGE